jgi:hypothetical protein
MIAAFVSLALALLPATTDGLTRTAHLTVPSRSPVTVEGTGFRRGERVAVTFSSKSTRTRTVIATARGAFRITFKSLSLGHCEAYAVRAKGDRGSSAFFRVIPECPAPGPSG